MVVYRQHRFRVCKLDIVNYMNEICSSNADIIQKAAAGKDEQVYGEISFYGARKLIKTLKLKSSDKLIDIGSGFGKFILQLGLETEVSELVGVEINPDRYKIACLLADEIKAKIEEDRKICFINDDVANVDFEGITCVYTCSTVFTPKILLAIGERINAASSIRVIATLRKIPNLRGFKLSRIVYLYCSWETVACYIYEVSGS